MYDYEGRLKQILSNLNKTNICKQINKIECFDVDLGIIILKSISINKEVGKEVWAQLLDDFPQSIIIQNSYLHNISTEKFSFIASTICVARTL